MSRKKAASRLNIFMNSRHVGDLDRKSHGGLEFTYAANWRRTEYAIPLSLSMPLREEPYRGRVVTSYFDNLLPDSEPVRKHLAEASRADSAEAFDLLLAIGRDCVGALQLIPDGMTYEAHSKVQGDILNARQVRDILNTLEVSPLGYDPEDNFRISIAGAQSKTALLKVDGEWLRPRGSTPTTHILKPAIGVLPNGIDLSNSVMNEYLCLRLCGFLGLPVAEAEIVDFAGTVCLVVSRFDRQWSADGKRILRLPQEDLCQALGLSGSQKYEDQGGPGFTDCMKLLMASDHALQDREIFLRTQLVFFLLGATDGHAKNFSIFLNPDGFRMTPLYDVLSAEPAMQARQIRWSKFRMSMCFGRGRHYQIRRLTFRHFEESCALAGMDLQTLYEVTTDLMARIQDLEGFAASLGKKIERRLLQSVLDGISRRATLFR